LEEKKIKIDEVFHLENGKMKIGSRSVKDDHKIQGYASLSKIVEQSSNIGLVKIARLLGEETFYAYIRKFGFFSLTGIELPGEEKGILAETKNWSALSLPNISFGQGISATAVQLIGAYSAIANGGILMKPMLIKKIEGAPGEQGKTFSPAKIRRVISEDTAAKVRKLLQNAVEKGTGKSAQIAGYAVAGKTGTAQKIDPETKTYSKKHYVASFCGMLPAQNPQITILVVVDEPDGDYYASSVASPVFSRIAARIAQYLDIPKSGER